MRAATDQGVDTHRLLNFVLQTELQLVFCCRNNSDRAADRLVDAGETALNEQGVEYLNTLRALLVTDLLRTNRPITSFDQIRAGTGQSVFTDDAWKTDLIFFLDPVEIPGWGQIAYGCIEDAVIWCNYALETGGADYALKCYEVD